MTCLTPDCTNPVENRDKGLCASCAHAQRKSEREKSKPVKKPKPIPKESKKRKVENKEYSILRPQFLIDNPECKPKFIGCTKTATQVHHTAKRVLELVSLNDWVNRVPRCLPEKTRGGEQLIWIDKNGNVLESGADFMAAEEQNSYPVKV